MVHPLEGWLIGAVYPTFLAGLAAGAPAPAGLAASPASKDKEPKEKKEKVVKEKPTWGEPGKGHSVSRIKKNGGQLFVDAMKW